MSIQLNDDSVLPVIVSTLPKLLITNGYIDAETPQDDGGNTV